MVVGTPSLFAIESQVTKAYEQLSLLALGSFTILIQGHRYGVNKPDASMLANSFDEVQRRIDHRGAHVTPFTEGDGGLIADAFRAAVYGEEYGKAYPDITSEQFEDITHLSRITWAPDGDEAFDDSSYVLQFDSGARVRLIAFTLGENGRYDPATLTDLWLESDHFYGVLEDWHSRFLAEWELLPKVERD
jgi:hypothetical protein